MQPRSRGPLRDAHDLAADVRRFWTGPLTHTTSPRSSARPGCARVSRADASFGVSRMLGLLLLWIYRIENERVRERHESFGVTRARSLLGGVLVCWMSFVAVSAPTIRVRQHRRIVIGRRP